VFVTLDERVEFGSLNKNLQKLVFKECRRLWVTIDFSQKNPRQTLTADMLKAFLERINAKDASLRA